MIHVFLTFLKLGLTSFGGPIAHIGYFHKEFVERKLWLSEAQFAQLLAICQFIPGPASSQLAFVIGYMRSGWLGALASFVGFTLPSVLLLIGLVSALPYLDTALGVSILTGLKIVAFAVVADAVITMFLKLCPDLQRRAIALLAMGVLVSIDASWLQLLVIVGGGLLGMLWCTQSTNTPHPTLSIRYSRTLGLVLTSLAVVLLIMMIAISWQHELMYIAGVFYQAGALVFGGGHVVLPLLKEGVLASGNVSEYHFLAGYGAAQTVPGPMFSISAYLGMLMTTNTAPLLGGLVATLTLFLPGFLLISGVLPLWQGLMSHPRSARTTQKIVMGVNASVVGVLAAALYSPIITLGMTTLTDWLIGIVALMLLVIVKVSILYIILWCVSASIILGLYAPW